MAPHSSTLAWKIPWTEEPGRLQSMGSLRVGHGWATSLSLFTFMHWRRKWQPTPMFLSGESQGRGSLVGQTGLKWLNSSSSSSSKVQETPLLSTTMQLVVKQRFPTSHKKDCSFSLPSFLKNPPLLLITSFLETNFLSIIYVIYFPVSAGLTQSRKWQQEICFLMWLAMPRVKMGLILNKIRVQNNLPRIFWGSVLLSLSIWQQRTTDVLGFISAYHIHDREEEEIWSRVTESHLYWTYLI